jgi:hypothetical protein
MGESDERRGEEKEENGGVLGSLLLSEFQMERGRAQPQPALTLPHFLSSHSNELLSYPRWSTLTPVWTKECPQDIRRPRSHFA